MHDIKTAKEVSMHEEEDRRAREKIEIAKAKKESLKLAEQEKEIRRLEKSKRKGKTKQVEEDKGKVKPCQDHVEEKDVNPPPSICRGCNYAIEDGIYANAFGVLWHPLCLSLHGQQPIARSEIPNCYVCEKKISLTSEGRKFNVHPFWKEKYCFSHDDDGTPKCCSCERLESCGTKYVNLEDGRRLCREYRETISSSSLIKDSQFQQKEALNKAEKEEKIDNHYGMATRGICLSEEQMVTSVSKIKRQRMGPNKQLVLEIVPKSQMVLRKCEVTAILILYGLPRFLTGYILAHEMMHAWLRLNGYRNLDMVLEEGLCQVLGHMWLEPQTYANPDIAAAASSSRTLPATTTSKKGEPSEYEKRLVKFCKDQIYRNR
ncbi:unnamed protein product [Arabidopsis lyrata]|nr:unnamed protein product [Arabidopsis lyrata]